MPVPYALLFPGQGSQHVGMGSDVFESADDLLGEHAESILGWSLRGLCAEGPEEDLMRTEHAQPALFAVAFALWRALEPYVPPPAASAGHSLGEYTALSAAGALSFDDGLRLVAARGRAMAAAADAEASGMAALIGGAPDDAEALCAAGRSAGERVWVANLNAPGQVVIAGASASLPWAEEHASEFGIRRVVRLSVAGAFHSPIMAPAAAALGEALAGVAWGEPEFPVWANATAAPHTGDIGATLLQQLTSTVRFAETLQGMAREGINLFLHVGPGDVTAGLARRSVESAETIVVSSLDDVEDAVARLAAAT